MPGGYRTVCINMKLSNVAISTLLSSAQDILLDGTAMAFDAVHSAPDSRKRSDGVLPVGSWLDESAATSASPLDTMASSAPAFECSKDL